MRKHRKDSRHTYLFRHIGPGSVVQVGEYDSTTQAMQHIGLKAYDALNYIRGVSPVIKARESSYHVVQLLPDEPPSPRAKDRAYAAAKHAAHVAEAAGITTAQLRGLRTSTLIDINQQRHD